jgi:large subunit ribosomal protein L28
MSKECHYCGKGTVIGRNVSHAHNVSRRPIRPNLQRVRALVEGSVQRVWVCTRCLRSGRVVKPPMRQWEGEAEGAGGEERLARNEERGARDEGRGAR